MIIRISKIFSVLTNANNISVVSTITLVIIFITASPATVIAQTDKDSADVLTFVKAYESIWDTHESDSVAGFFTKDADFVMGNLPATQGRQTIKKWWQNYFTRQEPERRLTIDVKTIRRLSSDAMLINVVTTTGGQNSQGKELLKRKARGTWLLHKKQGNWLISAIQGMPTEEDSVILKTSPEAAKILMPELRVFVNEYEDAFNNHDPDAVSALYRNDADIIVRNDSLIQGSRAIIKWWRDYFSKPRSYRALFIIDKIHMINADVALLNIVATGVPYGIESEQLSVRYARGIWILVRDEGEWLITALRVLPSMDDLILRKSYH